MADIIKPQLYTSEGIKTEVPDESINEEIKSGNVTAVKGDKIPVIKEDGTPVLVPSEYAIQGIKSGDYVYDTPSKQAERAEKREYATPTKALEAGAAGLARGVSVGLSDAVLAGSGLTDPDTLAKLKKHYPITSTVTELAGAIAPAILTGGESAVAGAAKYAPSALVTRVGNVAERAAAGLIETGAEKTIAQKIVQATVPAVTRGFAEGSMWGAGGALSEAAIGHPDEISEHFIANVGQDAIMGGIFGGALGLGAKGIEKTADLVGALKLKHGAEKLKSIAVNADELTQKATEAVDAAKDNLVSSYGPPVTATEPPSMTLQRFGAKKEIVEEITHGEGSLKPHADSIKEAGTLIGAPVMPEMVSDSHAVQAVGSWITKLHGTAAGTARQEAYQQGYRAVQDTITGLISDATTTDVNVLGKKIVDNLSEKFEARLKPLQQVFEQVKDVTGDIPIAKKAAKAAIEKLQEIAKKELYFTESASAGGASVKRAISDLDSGLLNSAEELNRLRSKISKVLSTTASPEERYAVGQVSEVLTEAYESSVLTQAKGKMAKADYQALLEAHNAAKAGYRSLAEDANEIMGQFGKKFSGPESFYNLLEDKNGSQILRTLFDTKEYKFLQTLQKKQPEIFKQLKDNYLGNIVLKHTKDLEVQTNQVLKEFNKLPDSTKRMLFNQEELKKINAATLWSEAVPKDINPSGTAQALILHEAMSGPGALGKMLFNNLQSGLAEKVVKAAVDPKNNKYIAGISKLSSMIHDSYGFIVEQSQKFISGAAKVTIPVGEVLYQQAKERKKESAVEKINKIHNLVSNPEQMIETARKSLAGVSSIAPQSGAEIVGKLTQSVNFLASKTPKNPMGAFAHDDWTPSAYDQAKFMRYYDAVQNPKSVVYSLGGGELTSEGVEALRSIYPNIYKTMVSSVMDEISKNKDVPYWKRAQVSILMGQPTDYSLKPDFIASMQSNYIKEQEGLEKSKFNANVDLASKQLSDTERVLTRA